MSSIREALKALEALGLVHMSAKQRSTPVDPERVLRVDAIALWVRGAESRQQVERAVRTFCELKWLLAEHALVEFIRIGPQSGVPDVVDAYLNIIIDSHPTASRISLVDWEICALWRAAHLLEDPALEALSNSLAGTLPGLAPLWDSIIEPAECKERAALLRGAVEDRSRDLRPETLRKMKEVEWISWRKRLEHAQRASRDARAVEEPTFIPPDLHAVEEPLCYFPSEDLRRELQGVFAMRSHR